ncbi:MAG: cation:proton antiporter [Pseudobdellovibrionaceae bacterium]
MPAHDAPLLTTIALGLSMAFLCGVIAHKLRLSPIVGYLLAGIAIGPFTPGYVADVHAAEQLSEIGIVLLMFGVGLHFSLKDLMDVRKIALPGAAVQIGVATALGAGVACTWGWPLSSGLMFGFACSVASTVVLLRALEDNHLLQGANGRIAIGWLIVEDILMVMALVFIPVLATLGNEEDDNGQHLVKSIAFAIGKMAMFVTFMLVIGNTLLPRILSYVAATRSRELFTLAVFAVAVGVAFAAGQIFGVSLALGAFFSGMMIRESRLSHEVAERALPLQDAFAVLFFVSVGMLFNPVILWTHTYEVILCVLIIMVGKSVAAFWIVRMFGYPLKTSLLVSAGLAQIGEFSFILVTMGVSLGILPPEGRDIILAGAMISISLNPLTFAVSRLIYGLFEKYSDLAKFFDMRDKDHLAHLASKEAVSGKQIVILVGAGQIGGFICDNINKDDTELIIIETNRQRVEDLRENELHAIAGDAGIEVTLREAMIDKAAAMVIAIPDPFEAGRIVDAARSLNPQIKIIVVDRYHNHDEAIFDEHPIDLKVQSYQEIGRRILGFISELR